MDSVNNHLKSCSNAQNLNKIQLIAPKSIEKILSLQNKFNLQNNKLIRIELVSTFAVMFIHDSHMQFLA